MPITQSLDTRVHDLAQGLSDDDILDVAAAVAARHTGLAGETAGVRSWLALLAAESELVQHLGGEPRQVLDGLESAAMLQARLKGEAVESIWQQPMLEPKDVALALDARPSNREKVRQFRKRSWLLGLPWGRGYIYPVFQFDIERRGLFPEVRRANEILDAAGDPWGVASWWISRHARLGARPADLVGTARSGEIVEAAGAVVEPVG